MEAARENELSGKLKGYALLVAPGLIFAASLFQPAVDFDDHNAVLDTVAANTGRWNLAGALFLLGFLLMIPAVIAAARYFRRQRPGFSLMATILAPIVPIMITGFSIFGGLDEALADPAADRAEMIALMERSEEVTLFPLLFGLLMVGLLGMLVLAIGLWRSRATPLWVPVLIVVGFVVVWFAPSDNAILPTLGNAILWAAFGAIGLKILSDAREGYIPSGQTGPT
jgi:hypothetical protein